MNGAAKAVLRLIALSVAILALTAIEVFRPDVIERVSYLLSKFAAFP